MAEEKKDLSEYQKVTPESARMMTWEDMLNISSDGIMKNFKRAINK